MEGRQRFDFEDRQSFDVHADAELTRPKVDEPQVDAPPPLKLGYGSCGVPGCGCPNFTGTGMACNGCGHQFGQHL